MSLTGTWRLVEYIVELNDGTTVKPWGEEFIGYTMVTENGFVSSSMVNIDADSVVDKDSFFSYFGQYDFDGEIVKISVVLCSEPSWIGGVQERIVEFEGDRFTAITPNMEWDGVIGTFKLSWTRI